MLFTRRYKISQFGKPKKSVALILSDNAKYLGLLLDSKLNWNQNTSREDAMALYCCKQAIALNWGINTVCILVKRLGYQTNIV